MVVLSVVGALTLSACGGLADGEVDSGSKTLRIGMTSDAQSLDPPNFVLVGDFTRDNLLYEGLVRLTKDNKIEPALATEWTEVSPTEWDFTLRKGVTFHDGTAFDSTAVKKSLERAAKQPQGKGFLSTIKEVQTPDPMTARIVLSRPFSALINNLSVPVAAIISPKALDEKDAKALAKEPVGTGPYKFVSWIPDTKMTFEANPEYWGEKATLDRVEFIPIPEASTRYSALQAGDVDVIESPPPDQLEALKSSPDLQPIIEPKARPIFIGFNLKTVKDPLVRKAVAHAIDRDAIIKNIVGGDAQPLYTICTPSQVGCTHEGATVYKYDPALSKKLLAEAGFPNGFEIPIHAYRERDQTEAMINYLQAVGIKAKLNFMQYAAMRDQERANKAALVHWTWGSNLVNDVSASTPVYFGGGADDTTHDAQVKELLDKGDHTVDAKARTEYYSKALNIIADKAYAVPLWSLPVYYVANKELNFRAYSDELPRFWEMSWK